MDGIADGAAGKMIGDGVIDDQLMIYPVRFVMFNQVR